MDDNNSSFLDKNTLVAIVLSILFFIGWQSYLQKKYPDSYKPKEKITQQKQDAEQNIAKSQSTVDGKATSPSVETEDTVEMAGENKPEDKNKPAKIFDIQSPTWDLKLSSKGMGLVSAELRNYSDRKSNNITFTDPTGNVRSFSTYYNEKELNFELEKKNEYHFIGTAKANGNTLMKEMIFNPQTYTVEVKIKTLTGSASQNDIIQTKIANKVLKVKSSMFTPAYEGTEFFAIDDGSEERERIDIEEAYSANFNKTSLTAIGTQYFAIALNDQSELIPKTKVAFAPESQVAYATLTYPAATQGNTTKIEYTGFVGPKKYDILKNLEPNFVKMINYGMFSILSKPMLSMLKWLHGLFQNWGLAIILLTICIRLLLLPINISSLKSMKKMQKLQPKLKALKEKYKDDPQRINQETMALMKKEKANPLGGCLPMLLQLPVFLALYSVLGQSVELYKSPFMLWIQDLSYQDPYFVLPIAVGGLYFIQMSLTPQPTDPAQAKVMKFIPLLFCFFMITVPSGLTLYFFVNTVFGIGQTFIFQREKRKAAA